MARYVRLDREPWGDCSKCASKLSRPFYWAPSKYAQHRKLCASCHDTTQARETLAYEMYRVDMDRYDARIAEGHAYRWERD